MPQLLRFAIALGATPLVIGSLVYFLWRLTRWSFLEIMGLATLMIGFVAFLGGAVCLIAYLRRETRNGSTPQRSLILSAVLVGGLLILNFPAAVFYTGSAIDISTRYTIRISNQSDLPIERVIISGPNLEHQLGPIIREETLIHHVYINAPGALNFTIHQSDVTTDGTLEDYVHKGSSGDKTITIHASSEYQITDHLK